MKDNKNLVEEYFNKEILNFFKLILKSIFIILLLNVFYWFFISDEKSNGETQFIEGKPFDEFTLKIKEKYLNETSFKNDFHQVNKELDTDNDGFKFCSDIKIKNSQGIEVFLRRSDLFASFNKAKVAVNINFLTEPYGTELRKIYEEFYDRCIDDNRAKKQIELDKAQKRKIKEQLDLLK